jgi:hypothetical protein
MKIVYTLEDLFGYPIGDVNEDQTDGTFNVYHYATDSMYGPFKSKDDAEIFLNQVEYDLK